MSRYGTLQYLPAKINQIPPQGISFCCIYPHRVYHTPVGYYLSPYATVLDAAIPFLSLFGIPFAPATACAMSAPPCTALLPAATGYSLSLPAPACGSGGTPGGRASFGRESSPSQKFPRTKADFSRKLTSKSILPSANIRFRFRFFTFPCSSPARN